MPDSDRSTLPIAVRAARVPPNAELNDPSLLFNRELSWIDFNWRVIYQALDERTPLLERARFLAIAQRNLDEFIAKRVGGLKSQQHAGVTGLSPDGLSPTEQLSLLRTVILEMQQRMADAWQKDLRGRVQAEAGVRIIDDWTVLSAEQAEELHALFRSNVYPILTPLVVDLGHPFPFISHLSLSLAIVLEDTKRGTRHFARLKLPLNRGRWVKFGDGLNYIAMEKLITRYAQELFPGMQVRGTHAFRVTRNAEVLDAESGEAEDLLQMISEELRERRFAPVVRLEVAASMPEDVRELLMSELELDPRDVHPVDGPIDLTCLDTFADLDVPALRFPPWEPVTPPPLLRAAQSGDVDIFAVVRAGDMLVHHPYESFSASVEAFVERAATDHRVLAIKQTLYRVSDDSRVARALIRAAEEGKQVAVLIEVTASLDEQRNIDIAQRMEKAGVHVAYGMMGLKTHTKITLVVREEPNAIRTYCHIGTGNYHERTARLYTDIGLFTASEQVGLDVVNMFHFLTGMAPEQDYSNLLVAPRDMRAELTALVEEEIRHGPDGHIILKMNGLDDVELIRTLYRASRAGVRVDLIVRGHTRLRPGIAGVSQNISLISILGRFLEHDRIFYFRNNGDPQIFIGSADWRRRNLEERVEALVRIDDPALKERLRTILDTALTDNRSAWDLHSDGRYQLRCPAPAEEARSFQDILMQRARDGQQIVVRRAS